MSFWCILGGSIEYELCLALNEHNLSVCTKIGKRLIICWYIFNICMQNNSWKIIRYQLPMRSPLELKDNSSMRVVQCKFSKNGVFLSAKIFSTFQLQIHVWFTVYEVIVFLTSLTGRVCIGQ